MSDSYHAGADMVTIQRWLGVPDTTTTSIYAELELESKRKALRLAKQLLSMDSGISGLEAPRGHSWMAGKPMSVPGSHQAT